MLRADRRGSSWPVVVDTDAGLFYTKLRGAAQAPATLVAEIIVGRLADALGLAVPARVLIDIPPDLRADDPHEELAELLGFSVGRSLGFQYVPEARNFRESDAPRVDADVASRIVWLDGLIQNPDRTGKNPNMLWSHDRLWLIDHGASLGFHHRWSGVTEDSPRSRSWRSANTCSDRGRHGCGSSTANKRRSWTDESCSRRLTQCLTSILLGRRRRRRPSSRGIRSVSAETVEEAAAVFAGRGGGFRGSVVDAVGRCQCSIRPYMPGDWDQVWAILEPVFRAGDTYAIRSDIAAGEAREYWTSRPESRCS